MTTDYLIRTLTNLKGERVRATKFVVEPPEGCIYFLNDADQVLAAYVLRNIVGWERL